MSIDKNEERWRQVLDAQGASQTTTVAAVDDGVVGFVSIGRHRSEVGDGKALDVSRRADAETVGALCGFYVHPDSWGTGVANELHDEAMEGCEVTGGRR